MLLFLLTVTMKVVGEDEILEEGISTYTLDSGDVLELNGIPMTLGGLNGLGEVATRGATLTIGAGNFSGNITGNGPLIKESAERLTLGGSNALSTIVLEGGSLEVHRQESIGNGTLTFSSPAQLVFSKANQTFINPIEIANAFLAVISGNQTTLKGDISGLGDATFTGTVTIAGNNSYSGKTRVDFSSVLYVASAAALSPTSDFVVDGDLELTTFSSRIGSLAGCGSVDLGQKGTLLTLANGKELIFLGALKGSGGIRLESGKWVLLPSAPHSYTGPTLVEKGAKLVASVNNAFSPGSDFIVDGILSLSDGAVDVDVNVQSISGTNPHANIDLGTKFGGVLAIGGSSSTSFAGTITGVGGMAIGANTSFTLNGKTSYLGGTKVNGELIAGAKNVFSPHSAYAVDGSLLLNDKTNSIGFLTGSGIVDLGFHSTTVLTVGGGDFSGYIIGLGQLCVDAADAFILQADNSYTGGTQVIRGTLALKGAGALRSTGDLTIQSGGTFDISQLTADSQTVADLRGDLGAAINLGEKQLIVDTTNITTYRGAIIGEGGRLLKQGKGSLTLEGLSTFTGGTRVADGTLIGTTRALTGDIQVDLGANLVFGQSYDGTFSGHLTGTGKLFKLGSGKVNLTSQVASFSGTTTVSGGDLAVNTDLGGSVTVAKGGTLSGNGTIEGDLFVSSGGVISPGNSIGMITVFGDYVQSNHTTFLVQVDGRGDSSLVDVEGTATLEGGEVIAKAMGRKIQLHHPYHFLHAEGGVNGSFETASVINGREPVLYAAKLVHAPNDVFLELVAAFSHAVQQSNQSAIAAWLDGIDHPTPQQNALLSQMAVLSVADMSSILQQLSGQQQAADLFAASLVNRSFIRRLYDPLRPLVTTLCPAADCCWTPWIEGGWGQSFLDNSSKASGFRMCGGQITAGIQRSFSELTLGVAACYDAEKISFKQGGTARLNNGLVGLYALYRPDCFYLLGDLAYGYFHDHLFRQVSLPGLPLNIGSSADINQCTLYGEGGVDLSCGPLLIQPFVALEGGGVCRGSVQEKGGSDFDLEIESRKSGTFYSRLGLHVTTVQWPCPFTVSLDGAWQYRFTKNNNSVWANIATFGTPFIVEGVQVGRNSLQGAATASFPCANLSSFYAEIEGEIWERASTYSLILGFTTSW